MENSQKLMGFDFQNMDGFSDQLLGENIFLDGNALINGHTLVESGFSEIQDLQADIGANDVIKTELKEIVGTGLKEIIGTGLKEMVGTSFSLKKLIESEINAEL
jgi:hypothetical protein